MLPSNELNHHSFQILDNTFTSPNLTLQSSDYNFQSTNLTLLSPDYNFQPPECGNERCQDLFPKFLYIVVMPAAIIITLIIILLIIICTRKRKSSVSPESDEKLAAYEAVRHASTNLRRMSHTNNTPLLASRSGSISVVRDQHRREARLRDSCHSAPGTLQRHPRNRDSSDWRNTPPPPPVYGMHPEYQLGDDDAFLGPEIPLQDFHVPELRQDGHHHQRPYSASNGYMTR